MNLPVRKQNRLSEYDYSRPNAYFITICTDKRKSIFWNNDAGLSEYGMVVDQAINCIEDRYPAVCVDKYVIMPNHVHLLLQIKSDEDGRPMAAPTISTIINQMKGAVSKRIGFPVWQKGFHDHVIRGEDDYRDVWNYIEGNPTRWKDDELYWEIAR